VEGKRRILVAGIGNGQVKNKKCKTLRGVVKSVCNFSENQKDVGVATALATNAFLLQGLTKK